jgi:hypothetical protein
MLLHVSACVCVFVSLKQAWFVACNSDDSVAQQFIEHKNIQNSLVSGMAVRKTPPLAASRSLKLATIALLGWIFVTWFPGLVRPYAEPWMALHKLPKSVPVPKIGPWQLLRT